MRRRMRMLGLTTTRHRPLRGRTRPWPFLLACALLTFAACGANPAALVPRPSPTHALTPTATATLHVPATPTGASTQPADPPGLSDAEQSNTYARLLRGPDAWTWRVGLPADRIMAYYFIPYAPWGFLGTYFDDPNGDALLLSRIQAQSQAYAALDPTHPIVNAIDIVDPVVAPYPGPDGYYADFSPDDLIAHYYDLATQHHMLFILDIQLGRMPVKTALTYLWPWIQRPNVEVALDPEFDVAPNGIPDVNLGIMHASEINQAVQMLANLVTTNHLPGKILIVHQWAEPSLPDWYNVTHNPNVSIITCSDGFGTPDMKINGDYAVFDQQQLIQYPGFKLFYPNWPGQRGDHPQLDFPLMAPADVLALNPQPLLVMYQ